MDGLTLVISQLKQLADEVVYHEGYLTIYPDKQHHPACICLIYEADALPEAINFSHAVYYIVLGNAAGMAAWGIPSEFISSFPYPVSPLPTAAADSPDHRAEVVTYVLNDQQNDPDCRISLSVISAFNCLLHLNCHCVVPAALIPRLKAIANSNISFTESRPSQDAFTGCRLLIAAGEPALQGILAGLPVIIAGPAGLGGLVTSDNLPAFFTSAFRGRPGGRVGERIASGLLMEEIKYAIEAAESSELAYLTGLSGSQYNNLRVFSPGYINEAVAGTILAQQQLIHCLSNGHLSRTLRPALSASVIVLEMPGSDSYWLQQVHTNKILAVAGEYEIALIRLCNGNRTLEEIVTALGSNYDLTDCTGFITSLWQQRILYFPEQIPSTINRQSLP
ncbi:hypothetical protein [Chitinophaga deserti]|uniref:hypothetical protein n=1 Tax=Chitinophaga deserti TaxID=2164099 RepID=UPI0013006445|nr:hypothetical protein [Chitinophaga deserti]